MHNPHVPAIQPGKPCSVDFMEKGMPESTMGMPDISCDTSMLPEPADR